MTPTIEDITIAPIEVSLNSHKYYLHKSCIDRYFITASVSSDRFTDIHNYTLEYLGIIAPKEICDTIMLDIATDFRYKLMKKSSNERYGSEEDYYSESESEEEYNSESDEEPSSEFSSIDKFLYYYTFSDMYLTIDPFKIIGGVIARYKEYFDDLYNYLRKQIIDSERSYDIISAVIVDAINRTCGLEKKAIGRMYNYRITIVEKNVWYISIHPTDSHMILFHKILALNNVDIFTPFCARLNVPKKYKQFMRLNPEDYVL